MKKFLNYSSPVEMPYDYSGIKGNIGWQSNLSWPCRPEILHEYIDDSINHYLRSIDNTDEKFSKKILLAGPWQILGYVWGCYEKLLCVQYEESNGVFFNSLSPELKFLREGLSQNKQIDLTFFDDKLNFRKNNYNLNFQSLRNLKMMNLWMPIIKIPKTFLTGSVEAISYNSLLGKSALDGNKKITYKDAKYFINQSRRNYSINSLQESLKLKIDSLAEKSILIPDTDDHFVQRFRELTTKAAKFVFYQVACDLLGLEKLKKIPKEVWSGTAGNYPARLVGLEALYRGGEVVRFDHGGSTGLTSPSKLIALNELCVSSKFVMGTHNLATYAESYCSVHESPGITKVQYSGANGFPHLNKLSYKARKILGKKKNVIYLSSFSRNLRKNPTHSMAELIYLDWSLRLAGALSRLPINLVCQPHPASFHDSGKHELSSIAKVSTDPFEKIMDWADIYVCDIVNSTTFWEILCTECPVIYFNLGINKLNPAIEEQVSLRCQTINTLYDQDNIPQFNSEELKDNILNSKVVTNSDQLRKTFIDKV